MRFFTDRLLGTSADSLMAKLHDTGESLRMFDGWGEMCIIETKVDGPIVVHESTCTITKDDFADVLNQNETKLWQGESL